MGATDGGRDLIERTRVFGLDVMEVEDQLPVGNPQFVVGKQLLRAGTATGAAYREAEHARTDAEFVSKIHIGLQELEETRYWLELLGAKGLGPRKLMRRVYRESLELTSIFVSIAKDCDG